MQKVFNIIAVFFLGYVGFQIYKDHTMSYTLYRNSPLDLNARIHVASFNANESEAYNSDMCNFVQGFLQNNPQTQARWWCEAGPAKNLSK